jgi:hypothetical protein
MTEDPITPRPARDLFAVLLAMSAVQACSSRAPSDIIPLAGSVWGTKPPAAAQDLPKHTAAELAAHPCTNDFQCNDVDPCTLDWCAAGKCAHQPAPSGVSCRGGVYSDCVRKGDCVQAQVCWGGRCTKARR